MKTLGKILMLIMSPIILSCATGEKFSSIREGMSQQEVTNILGNHDQLEHKDGGWTIYSYKNRLISGWSWDKTDYHVVFNPQGQVYEYGHGPVDTRTSERMMEFNQQIQQNSSNSRQPTQVNCTSTKDAVGTVHTSCQ